MMNCSKILKKFPKNVKNTLNKEFIVILCETRYMQKLK